MVHSILGQQALSACWLFLVTRFDYNGAQKSHDLLKIQGLSFVKKNLSQDLLSSMNAVISNNERH